MFDTSGRFDLGADRPIKFLLFARCCSLSKDKPPNGCGFSLVSYTMCKLLNMPSSVHVGNAKSGSSSSMMQYLARFLNVPRYADLWQPIRQQNLIALFSRMCYLAFS